MSELKDIAIRDVKAGMRLMEECGPYVISFVAQTDAQRVENREGVADGWEFMALCDGNDEEVRYFAADGWEHYGPQLTTQATLPGAQS